MTDQILIAVAAALVTVAAIAARIADRWQEHRDITEVDRYLRLRRKEAKRPRSPGIEDFQRYIQKHGVGDFQQYLALRGWNGR